MTRFFRSLTGALPLNRDFMAALLTGYGLTVVTIGIQFALVPLYLDILGKERFGVLAIILAANNYGAIGVTWLSGSMARIMAERSAVGDQAGFAHAYAFAKYVYVSYAVVALAIFWMVAPWLLPNALADAEIRLAAILSSLYFLAAYEYNADRQALTARHLQARGNFGEAAGQLVFAACALAGLYNNLGLPGVIVAQIAGIISTRYLAWRYWQRDSYGLGWKRKIDGVEALWRRVSGKVGRDYVLYGIFLLTLQADALILGVLGGPHVAAEYYLLWRIPEVCILLLWRIPGSYSPYLIAMDARGEREALTRGYRSGLAATVVLAGVGALVYGGLGNEILHLWVGDNAPHGHVPYIIAAAAMFLFAITRWPAEVAFALLNTRALVRVTGLEMGLKLAVMLAFFGVAGYLSPLLGLLAAHVLGVFYLYLRVGKESCNNARFVVPRGIS